MSKKTIKAPVRVKIVHTEHSNDPLEVRILMPGKRIWRDLQERYGARRSAVRAALRDLGLWNNTPGIPNKGPWSINGHPVLFEDIWTGKGRP